MKKLLVLTTALALAACGQKADTTPATDVTDTGTMAGTPATAPVASQAPTGNMAGVYEMKMADGTMTTQTINADGTYTSVSGGKETKGSWRMDGANSCFDPAGDAAEVCQTASPVAADGSFTVTRRDGVTMTVRKVGAAPAM